MTGESQPARRDRRVFNAIFLATLVGILAALVNMVVADRAPSDRPDEPVETGFRADPDRDLPGPDYIPEGAPLKPPPAAPPRAGYKTIDFDTLSAFDYDAEANVVPEDVEALSGTLVELLGVMYYGVEDPDRVEDFYLMPSHLVCCFGTPRANDTVSVKLKKGSHTQYVLNYYLIRGRITVELLRDNAGNALALYRITDAEAEVLE
ncbi:MAG: hypothetical protein V3T86_13090 [Planctomycetota bacterium]